MTERIGISKQKINVFMLSIAYEGQATPLFWQLLNKADNANIKERKALLEQFIDRAADH